MHHLSLFLLFLALNSMKKLLIILLTGFAAILSSCIYSDFGEYYFEPVPGDPADATATTNLDSLGNIILTDSLEVTYEIEIENGEFYQIEARLSEFLIYLSDTTHGGFWIHTTMWEEVGVDTLRLNIYYSSNSNSLGDIVGVEADLLKLKYPITFEESPE